MIYHLRQVPPLLGLIVSHIFRAYIIISFIYYVCIIAPALISHPFTNMHQKAILIIIYFQNRWSHDSMRHAAPAIERLMVRGSRVAIKHVIHDMVTRTLLMELRRRAIKRWVPCDDMDRRLKIPHSAKVECGFRTTPEECLYDSGPIGPSV